MEWVSSEYCCRCALPCLPSGHASDPPGGRLAMESAESAARGEVLGARAVAAFAAYVQIDVVEGRDQGVVVPRHGHAGAVAAGASPGEGAGLNKPVVPMVPGERGGPVTRLGDLQREDEIVLVLARGVGPARGRGHVGELGEVALLVLADVGRVVDAAVALPAVGAGKRDH